MRISKRTRELAAHICQLAASNEWDHEYSSDQFAFDGEDDALDLANAARNYAANHGSEQSGDIPWAEADALLRCGPVMAWIGRRLLIVDGICGWEGWIEPNATPGPNWNAGYLARCICDHDATHHNDPEGGR